jgi:hypothetical protein
MQTTSQAMQAYVRGLAAAPSHDKTLKELAALPYLPVQPSEGTFVDAYLEGEGKSKKRPRKSEATAAGGAPKEKKPKKIKDPNAPKRPASGFIMFQNTRRAAVKEEHANLDYKGQMALISEEWKTMDPAEKAVSSEDLVSERGRRFYNRNGTPRARSRWRPGRPTMPLTRSPRSTAPQPPACASLDKRVSVADHSGQTPDAESDNDSSEEDKKVVKKSAKQASATTSVSFCQLASATHTALQESGSGEDDSSSDDEAPSKKKVKHSTPPVSKASASKPKSSKKTK